MFPEILRGSLWHTTSAGRLDSILKTCSILPNPQIPDSERWSTECGPNFYPYVRSIGGVSIFDFTEFDEFIYSEKYPMSSWRIFVPCFDKWDTAIWIELNLEIIKKDFIDGSTLLELWKQQEAYRRKIMPKIEAAHVGPIHVNAFRRIFKYSIKTKEFTQLFLP